MVEVTATFSDEAFALLKALADEKGLGVSELLRRTMLDWLEEEEDIRDADAAYAEYLKNPVTYTLDEIKTELGLDEIVQSENIAGCSQEVAEDGRRDSGAYSKLA